MAKARPRPQTSTEPTPTVHFAPTTNLIRSGVGVLRQPIASQLKRQADSTSGPLVALPRPQLRSRPTSYAEEPNVHSGPSSSAGTVEPSSYWKAAVSGQQDSKVHRSRTQPFTTNFTTYVPAGVKTATVDTTYLIGPRHLSKESPDLLPSSRSRARWGRQYLYNISTSPFSIDVSFKWYTLRMNAYSVRLHFSDKACIWK